MEKEKKTAQEVTGEAFPHQYHPSEPHSQVPEVTDFRMNCVIISHSHN